MKKKGFTLIELLVVVAIIALLISILLPSLSRARELTKRAVCSSNLRGIGSGCHIYSNENQEWFPQSYYKDPTNFTEQTPYAHQIFYTSNEGDTNGKIGQRYWERTTTEETQEAPSCTAVSISRSLFMLITGGQCTAKLFICPSSGETEDTMRNMGDEAAAGSSDPGTTGAAAQAGVNRFDFRGYNTLSYAYQMPFGMKGKPRNGMDPRLPLAADKSPYCQTGTEDTSDRHTPEQLRAGDIAPSWTGDEDALLTLPTESWRPYNSRNHNGEGQNVLSADGHVEYYKVACVGLNSDNIYTRTLDWTFNGTFMGTKPVNQEGPYTNTDTVLIP